MATSVRIEAAFRRLYAALDQLEAFAERVGQAGDEARDLSDTLAIMQDDRSRLADELDAALARAQALEQANDQVADRLSRAGGTLRRMLTETEAAPSRRREESAG